MFVHCNFFFSFKKKMVTLILMNEFQLQFCKKYIQKIKDNPIGDVVINTPNGMASNLTFSLIEKKLNKLQYASIYDFAIDFNDFLYDKIDCSEPNSPENFILNDFLEQFQKKIQNAPRNEKEFKASKIKKLSRVTKIIISIMEPKFQDENCEQSNGLPQMKSSLSFSSLIKQPELDELQKKIDQITDENVLIKVYQILRENIPDLQFGSEVTIDKTQINHKCLKSLKSLLLQ